MAAKLLVMYNHPTDPAAFDTYYAETHTPIAKTIPDMRSLVVSTGPIIAPDGSPVALSPNCGTDLRFDGRFAGRDVTSSEGRATAGDLRNFAGAGVTLVVYETREA